MKIKINGYCFKITVLFDADHGLYSTHLDEDSDVSFIERTLTAKEKDMLIPKPGATINYTDTHRINVKAGLKTFWKNKKTDTAWLKSRASPKKYVLSNGIDFIRIENLKEYCELNNLADSTLCSIATGNRYRPVKGWYCFYDTENEEVLRKIAILEEKQTQVKNSHKEKAQNRMRYDCIHCGASVTQGNLTRWHNDNCKKK